MKVLKVHFVSSGHSSSTVKWLILRGQTLQCSVEVISRGFWILNDHFDARSFFVTVETLVLFVLMGRNGRLYFFAREEIAVLQETLGTAAIRLGTMQVVSRSTFLVV